VVTVASKAQAMGRIGFDDLLVRARCWWRRRQVDQCSQ
jgi:hypothetical protein